MSARCGDVSACLPGLPAGKGLAWREASRERSAGERQRKPGAGASAAETSVHGVELAADTADGDSGEPRSHMKEGRNGADASRCGSRNRSVSRRACSCANSLMPRGCARGGIQAARAGGARAAQHQGTLAGFEDGRAVRGRVCRLRSPR